MTFKFGNFIKDEISYESLQQFLKKFKLPYSFKKEVLFDNIEEELTKESPKLTEEDVYELINHEIKYGRRRYLFTSIINNSDSRKIESDRNIGNALRELTGSKNNTYINNLNTQESNTFSEDLINELIIEYLNIKKMAMSLLK
ncbi:hypothetical protein OR571_13445 [Psychrobacillus sp. NEAU-3TGS]|uniref:hypothetical protein n=1 Tax=Psychrobacillus sp. NEAU-3TGS TaxID=2995412 RepID=UPI00249716BC|nr:hypothetical protein [Psychrobacillus sp. NEAU-3TGS]MDI2588093.1 hypothetical protein [Psychrobacillus sp. NEAU-3TGS]